MNSEPKTAADLLALPQRAEGFGAVEKIVDGRKVVVPVSHVMQAIWIEGENTVQRARDERGQWWALCKDEDGWFRKRVL